MYYHFITGPAGSKAVMHTSALAPGMKLDTMYTSSITKRPFQLTVLSATNLTSSVNPKVQIKSVGTTANVFRPNIKCGAGVAHMIDGLMVPVPMSLVAAAVKGRR